MSKNIGILGGMGPAATADLFQKIIGLTPARSDQDHLRIFIDNNPGVPDRTEAIISGGKSPLPELIEMAQGLEQAGADLLLMPCNTAHHFHGDIDNEISIPLLHMIELVAEKIAAEEKAGTSVGILATDGTLQAEIYQKELRSQDLKPALPSQEAQNNVMNAIYGIKERGVDSRTKELIKKPIDELIEAGVEVIIAGCTELPLLPLERIAGGNPVIDPGRVLAEKAVEMALSRN